MRTLRRSRYRGFTLVELMIVVAIIGVLAALAIYGVRKYLASAKTAEAKNTLSAINHAAVAAYERENQVQELKIGTSSVFEHILCKAAQPVPSAAPKNAKYTADPTPGKDYLLGSPSSGWVCLKFEMNEPQYYAYEYNPGSDPQSLAKPSTYSNSAGGQPWIVVANGDLDGVGGVSKFATGGSVLNGTPVTSTSIAVEDELD